MRDKFTAPFSVLVDDIKFDITNFRLPLKVCMCCNLQFCDLKILKITRRYMQ